ncbi:MULTISPECIES: MerR family transcriptional regulator [unclassified Enterococcus]|jgi:DNA-binding transcriptional MerR regulator|uniref:MerR family transcriptional regulator n=1 Tax=unclassified Enterococcus TaxID=2608891 RepID=UPI003D2BED62
MEYTIKKMTQLSGVSARTLRFYDEIGLLRPARINSSGYRIYGENEIDRLQQILFYRSLDFKLETIRELLDNKEFDKIQSFEEQKQLLLKKREQLDALLTNIQHTIDHHKGERNMSSEEKFEAFKKQKLQENEEKYGQEIREKYGKETVEASNKKWGAMSEEDFQEMQQTEQELFVKLSGYLKEPDIESNLAKEIFQLHKKWLSFSWGSYAPEAHKGLGEMYVADERFASYYNDRIGNGAADALNKIINRYAM